MIRIDALWLSVEPMDMRVGAERLLARVVQVFGEARAHHGYLFANTRANRVKLLVHDGFGVWCCARRLNTGGFLWPKPSDSGSAGSAGLTLTQQHVGADSKLSQWLTFRSAPTRSAQAEGFADRLAAHQRPTGLYATLG